MKYKLVIFDLDGTILDTLCDLADSVNSALTRNGLPERSLREIRAFVGNGIRCLIERSVPDGCEASVINSVFTDFKEHYKNNCCNKTKPYHGIIDLVARLKSRGSSLAVVSNKADFAVREIMDRYFNGLFDYSAGEKDGIPRKPAPDSVNETLKYFGVQPEDALYVGDSEVDIATARNAGVTCLCVTWGFRDKDFLIENGALNFADNITEAAEFILA